MARLTLKEADFTLYETGFAGDVLDRAASGTALSNLVERIDDPMVIALNGGWGTGKSWFLKRWVGQHRKDHPGKARTVYFDAFAHDYLDSPLVALTAVLTKELTKEATPASGKIDKLKQTAFKALPGLTKLGANLATGFAVKALDDTGDILAEAIGGAVEGSSDAFWQSVANQQTAMEEFASALKALTLTEGEHDPRKLVIVVDELDRCRPDYALSLLEVIKHFFAVDHVHFVQGVNLRELENMVRVRYGTREGAELYLQKFVTLTMQLPEHAKNQGTWQITLVKNTEFLGVDQRLTEIVIELLELLSVKNEVTLRDSERIVGSLVLATASKDLEPNQLNGFHLSVLAALLVYKAIMPDFYKVCLAGKVDTDQFNKRFHPRGNGTRRHQSSFDKILERHLDVFGFDHQSEPDGEGFTALDRQKFVQEISVKYLSFNFPLNADERGAPNH